MENFRNLSASNEWRDQTMRSKYLYNESRFRFTWESQLEMRAWIFPWHWIFDQKLETWKKRLESKILDTIFIIKFECVENVQQIDIDIGIYICTIEYIHNDFLFFTFRHCSVSDYIGVRFVFR